MNCEILISCYLQPCFINKRRNDLQYGSCDCRIKSCKCENEEEDQSEDEMKMMEECTNNLMEMMENEAATDNDMEEVIENNQQKDECKADKEKYCDSAYDKDGNKHTLCAYCGIDTTKCKTIEERIVDDKDDQQKLVDLHNNFRRIVAKGLEKRGGGQPIAVNMNELIWDDDLAYVAQRWADQCSDGHDRSRLIDGHTEFPFVGQNVAYIITTSSGQSKTNRNYDKLVKAWYDEVVDFPKSSVSAFNSKSPSGRPIGHYTALVWGETTKVGCGYMVHSDRNNGLTTRKETLVCNYAAGGNVIDHPVYKTGKKVGSECQFGHNDGLCRPEKKN